MKVCVTGWSGFLGQYICKAALKKKDILLIKLGKSDLSDIKWDITQGNILIPQVDLFIHNAGLAHINQNNRQELFYRVNEIGTINICKSISQSKTFPNTFVFISTVAVYGATVGELITEDSVKKPLNAYGQSKLNAEKYLRNWADNNNVNLIILRLPLVVGFNPPGNLGAMIKAIRHRYYFRYGNGEKQRSMVLAEDISEFLFSCYGKHGEMNLTDNINPTFSELEDYIAFRLKRRIFLLPKWIIRTIAFFGDFVPLIPINSYRIKIIENTVTYSTEKAITSYSWKPRPVIGNFEIQ